MQDKSQQLTISYFNKITKQIKKIGILSHKGLPIFLVRKKNLSKYAKVKKCM